MVTIMASSTAMRLLGAALLRSPTWCSGQMTLDAARQKMLADWTH
jgi:hypothetical protein